MTATLPSKSVPPRVASDNREQLLESVRQHEGLAQQAASQGDLAEAARAILAVLDAERRMAAQVPQVLQLIKPRS